MINKDLLNILNKFIEIMKNTNGVLGAWHFGSVMRGMSDKFSDIDVVFLIESRHFSKMEKYCTDTLGQICSRIILCWEEEFNSNIIVNNGYLLETADSIFQFDLFLLNSSYIDDHMCSIHYTELSEKDIIFDKNNTVLSLCGKNFCGELWQNDTDRIFRTYLYHFNMTAKYLLRGDLFKLNSVMRTLYDAHASLLLTAYDRITWGGRENKLHFIPYDKQEHLKCYYCTDDFKADKKNLITSFEWFEQDIRQISLLKESECDLSVAENIKRHWLETTINL